MNFLEKDGACKIFSANVIYYYRIEKISLLIEFKLFDKACNTFIINNKKRNGNISKNQNNLYYNRFLIGYS